MEEFDWIMGAVFPYINFAIFAFLCFKFFKKPLNGMAEKRRSDYESLFAAAKAAQEEAQRQSAEVKARLLGLDKEILEITEIAQKAAEKEAEETVKNARLLAEHIKEEAKRVAEAEVQNAKSILQNEVVRAVTKNVTEKFKTELDSTAHEGLLTKRIHSLESVALGGTQ